MSSVNDSNEESLGQKSSLTGLSRYAEITLGFWSFYFIAKLALYWLDLIGFHTWINLAFAAFIMVPVGHVLVRRLKLFITILLAIALLYYDSWLPPIGRVLSQISLLSGFSATYLLELVGRFISLPVVLILCAALLAYWFISRWLRMDTFVIITMMGMPAMVFFQNPAPESKLEQLAEAEPDWYTQSEQSTVKAEADVGVHNPDPSPKLAIQTDAAVPAVVQTSMPVGGEAVADSTEMNMDQVLARFFKQESTRAVSFPTPKPDDIPFDVIFIHVCSLSWDDLKVTGLDKHPIWRRFDILLTRFNSASTYSGPAAIRIQRATCGQSTHTQLYSAAASKCYLMDSLKRSGFETSLVLNHDGHFDDFLKVVQRQGQFNVPPFPPDGSLITQHAFDDTPIYEDLSVLNRWMAHRIKTGGTRTAMYYNTVSLHDGNHLAGPNAKLNSQENFVLRLTKMLDDLDRFMQDLEASGRRAVVAVVPEHGAALRGDKMQISGLREIPSPAITLVPVGIKVIGKDAQRKGDQLKVGKPTSYLAVSHIIARMLKNPPYASDGFIPAEYIADLPVTPFVAQNGDVVLASYKGRYFLRQEESEWVDYSDFMK